MEAPAIEVKGISKAFGPVKALSDVSFEIPKHSIFGVLGPNGAGKTTLFSVIAGFLRPDKGSVSILGREGDKALQGMLSILPQDARFQSNIPIIDQLIYFLRLLGWNKTEAAREVLRVLKLVGLDDLIFREADTLSHGMYKRLALAQAFLGSSEVIILDEPTTGLDAANAENIRSLIKELQQTATIVVSSHDMEEMKELCDFVVVFDKGVVQSVGSVDNVTGSALTINMELDKPIIPGLMKSLQKLPGIDTIIDNNNSCYRVNFSKGMSEAETDAALNALQKKLVGEGLIIRQFMEENKLKELYFRVTSGSIK